MRVIAAIALALFACNDDDGHGKTMIDASTVDASPIDGTFDVCRAASGTASITVNHSGTVSTWPRVDAGGTWFTGPVAAVGPPMSLALLFNNTDPFQRDAASCCMYAGSTCCTTDGLLVTVDSLPYGAEVGQHAAMISRFQPGVALSGTLTITTFSHPFDHSPGLIAGSISGASGGDTVNGSFENNFCTALLSATI